MAMMTGDAAGIIANKVAKEGTTGFVCSALKRAGAKINPKIPKTGAELARHQEYLQNLYMSRMQSMASLEARSDMLGAANNRLTDLENQLAAVSDNKEGILNIVGNARNNMSRKGLQNKIDAQKRGIAEFRSTTPDVQARATFQDEAAAINAEVTKRREAINWAPIGSDRKKAFKAGGFTGLMNSYQNVEGNLNWGAAARDAAGLTVGGAVGLNALGDAGGLLFGNRTLTTDEVGRKDIALVPFI